MDKKGQYLGMGAALAANLIFGFSFLFSKTALLVAHPLVILAVRFTVAFAVMNVLILLRAVKIDLKGKNLYRLIIMGVAQPLLYFIFELYGLKLVSSALSGIIIALVPVGVILLSGLILGEKPSCVQCICTAFSIVGVSAVSIISNNGDKSHFLGILLLIGAVISASVFNIFSRDISKEFTPFARTYVMFLIGCIGFNCIAAAVLKGKYISSIFNAVKDVGFDVSIIYLAVVSSVLAFLLYNYSTSKISAVRSSSFSNIITVVSVLAGILILKEDFSVWQILLCIPIILGVWGVNRV